MPPARPWPWERGQSKVLGHRRGKVSPTVPASTPSDAADCMPVQAVRHRGFPGFACEPRGACPLRGPLRGGARGAGLELILQALSRPRSREVWGAYPLRTCLRNPPPSATMRAWTAPPIVGPCSPSPRFCRARADVDPRPGPGPVWRGPGRKTGASAASQCTQRHAGTRSHVLGGRPSPPVPPRRAGSRSRRGRPFSPRRAAGRSRQSARRERRAAAAWSLCLVPPIPRHPLANVPGRAREARGAHPLRTPSSQGLAGPSWSPAQGCLGSGRGALVCVPPPVQ
jgi:hypothetical protein